MVVHGYVVAVAAAEEEGGPGVQPAAGLREHRDGPQEGRVDRGQVYPPAHLPGAGTGSGGTMVRIARTVFEEP